MAAVVIRPRSGLASTRRTRWLLGGVGLIAATVWMRVPTWNDRILFIDEAVLVAFGQRLQLPGATVYTHTPDMKPPLGPLTYWAAVSLSPQHAIAVVHGLTTVAFGVTALLILATAVHFADSAVAGVLGGVLYLLSTATFPGFEPQFAFSSYDHFMAPWLLGAAGAFLVALQRDRAVLAALSGALLGVAALYKQNAPVMGVALALEAVVVTTQRQMSRRRAAILVGAALSATLAVVLSAPAYYALRGQIAEWWFFNVESLRRYSTFNPGVTWTARAAILVRALPLAPLAPAALGYGLLGWLRRERQSWLGDWTLLAAMCWLAVLVSLVPGQHKAHYVAQVLPFECALIGLLLVEAWRGWRTATGARRAALAVAAVTLIGLVGWSMGTLYRHRAALLEYIARDGYLALHRRAGVLGPVVDYVDAHSGPDDLLYVQGAAPEFYFLTQRRPAGSDPHQGWFVWPWNFEAAARLLRELQAAPPRFIVQLGYRRYFPSTWFLDGFPGFCAWMHANYRERVVADQAQVLERVDPATWRAPTAAAVPLGELLPVACAQTAWMRLDRSAAGAPLSVTGTVYGSGVGVRAPSAIDYAVPGGYATFVAAAGVDDRSGDGDAVRFRVEVDDAVRFERVARRGDPPVTVAVDVDGAGTLRLVADPEPAGPGRNAYADWLDARLLRAASPAGAR
jgi:hypothetical protein